jgi:hypothetical protein
MGVGWGEWASQVEHSSTEEQGCMWECTSICARSAVRIAVCVRYCGMMVHNGRAMAMEGVELECMHEDVPSHRHITHILHIYYTQSAILTAECAQMDVHTHT